jgi:hypothetical protein
VTSNESPHPHNDGMIYVSHTMTRGLDGAHMEPRATKIEMDFRRHAGTGTAGAITGGAIGAFTAGPVGTIVGMVIGGVAASVFEHYMQTRSESPKQHASPTK